MGGFLGVGEDSGARRVREKASSEAEAAKAAAEEAALIRLAERRANKGQETAKVDIGAEGSEEEDEFKKKGFKPKAVNKPSNSLGIGGGSGVQL